MAKYVKVNWTSLKKMSDNTLKNASDFEQARLNFQQIINSLGECWIGTDSESFIKNCNQFLNDLKEDSKYFQSLGEFFDKGSKVYSGVVNTHSEKVKKINDVLDEENNKYKLYDETKMVGDVNVQNWN